MRPLHLLPPSFHGSANATGNRAPYVAPAHVVRCSHRLEWIIAIIGYSCVCVVLSTHRLDSFPESLCIYGRIRSVLIWRVDAVCGDGDLCGVYIPMLVFNGLHQSYKFLVIRFTFRIELNDSWTPGHGWELLTLYLYGEHGGISVFSIQCHFVVQILLIVCSLWKLWDFAFQVYRW